METEVKEEKPLVAEGMRKEIETAVRGINERLMRKTEALFNRNMKRSLRINELAVRIGQYRVVEGSPSGAVYNTLYLTTSKGILFKKAFYVRDTVEDQTQGSFDHTAIQCLSTLMRFGLSRLIVKMDTSFPEELI